MARVKGMVSLAKALRAPDSRQAFQWSCAVLAWLISLWAGSGMAAQPIVRPVLSPDPAALCDLAARSASVEFGVPFPVLTALMLTESGRKQDDRLRPWPWTVNMEGAGHWFDTQANARAFVDLHFRRGARSFDVGCFQINYKWHQQGFNSIDEMFEPLANARYAARFLRELFIELGSWDRAAGAYHSRTPELAERYRARFLQHHARVASNGVYPDPAVPVLKAGTPVPGASGTGDRARIGTNHYPLLQIGSGGVMGSLVPTGLFRARPLLSPGPQE